MWDVRLAHYALHPEVRVNGAVSASPEETMALWTSERSGTAGPLKQLQGVMMT